MVYQEKIHRECQEFQHFLQLLQNRVKLLVKQKILLIIIVNQ
jgi:hypothetical protein